MEKPRPVIFLDRDGTLIEDTGYLKDPEPVLLLPRVAEGLAEFKRKGYLLFVVSNQSGVGRGLITDAQFTAVHSRVVSLLGGIGIELDGFAYCFHRPEDGCACRKPGVGLIPKELYGTPLDLTKSIVVGDRRVDLELGHALGANAFLVLSGTGIKTQDALSRDPTPAPWRKGTDLLEIAKLVPAVPFLYN